MCVLDFYVHESRQRMGCGRRLFDFMLKVHAYSSAFTLNAYGSAFTFFSQSATTFTTDDYCVSGGRGGVRKDRHGVRKGMLPKVSFK